MLKLIGINTKVSNVIKTVHGYGTDFLEPDVSIVVPTILKVELIRSQFFSDSTTNTLIPSLKNETFPGFFRH